MVKIVAHPESGQIITPRSNNPEYGVIRVDTVLNGSAGIARALSGDFANLGSKTAFIGGRVADLEKLNLKAGQKLPGTVQRKLSRTAFYEGQEPVKNPTTGEVVMKEGSPFFQQFTYTDAENAPSEVWVETTVHANVEEGVI